MALSEFPIPNVKYFVNKNAFCGSNKGFNYRLTPIPPDKEKNTPGCLQVCIWYGMLCSDLSDIQAEESFELNEDGLTAATEWIRAQNDSFQSTKD